MIRTDLRQASAHSSPDQHVLGSFKAYIRQDGHLVKSPVDPVWIYSPADGLYATYNGETIQPAHIKGRISIHERQSRQQLQRLSTKVRSPVFTNVLTSVTTTVDHGRKTEIDWHLSVSSSGPVGGGTGGSKPADPTQATQPNQNTSPPKPQPESKQPESKQATQTNPLKPGAIQRFRKKRAPSLSKTELPVPLTIEKLGSPAQLAKAMGLLGTGHALYQPMCGIAKRQISDLKNEDGDELDVVQEISLLGKAGDVEVLDQAIEALTERLKSHFHHESVHRGIDDLLTHAMQHGKIKAINPNKVIDLARVVCAGIPTLYVNPDNEKSVDELDSLLITLTSLFDTMSAAEIKKIAHDVDFAPAIAMLDKIVKNDKLPFIVRHHADEAKQALVRVGHDLSSFRLGARRVLAILKGVEYLKEAVDSVSIVALVDSFTSFQSGFKPSANEELWYDYAFLLRVLLRGHQTDKFKEVLNNHSKLVPSGEYPQLVAALVCYLGEISLDDHAPLTLRLFARDRLDELYVQDTKNWGWFAQFSDHRKTICKEILALRGAWAQDPDDAIRDPAVTSIQSIKKSHTVEEGEWIKELHFDQVDFSTLPKRALQAKVPRSYKLFTAAKNAEIGLNDQIDKVRARQTNQDLNPDLKQHRERYVQPRGAKTPDAKKTENIIPTIVQTIEARDKQVINVYGPYGVGKTEAMMELTYFLALKKFIVIELPPWITTKGDEGMVTSLTKQGYTQTAAMALKGDHSKPKVVIGDGFDDRLLTEALNVWEEFNLAEWGVHSVVQTCRPEFGAFTRATNAEAYSPRHHFTAQTSSYEEFHLMGFTDDDLDDFYTRYVTSDPEAPFKEDPTTFKDWGTAKAYIDAIEARPWLKALVKKSALNAKAAGAILPELAVDGTELNQVNILTRYLHRLLSREANILKTVHKVTHNVNMHPVDDQLWPDAMVFGAFLQHMGKEYVEFVPGVSSGDLNYFLENMVIFHALPFAKVGANRYGYAHPDLQRVAAAQCLYHAFMKPGIFARAAMFKGRPAPPKLLSGKQWKDPAFLRCVYQLTCSDEAFKQKLIAHQKQCKSDTAGLIARGNIDLVLNFKEPMTPGEMAAFIREELMKPKSASFSLPLILSEDKWTDTDLVKCLFELTSVDQAFKKKLQELIPACGPLPEGVNRKYNIELVLSYKEGEVVVNPSRGDDSKEPEVEPLNM